MPTSRPLWFRMTIRSTRRALSYSLVRSLVRALRCAHSLAPLRSFARSLAHSLALELMGKRFLSMNWMRRFYATSTHSAPPSPPPLPLRVRHHCTLGRNSMKSMRKMVGHLLARPLALLSAHSFAGSTLHASLTCSAALIRLLARSLPPKLKEKRIMFMN